jgi:hypothetical protein
MTDLFIVRAFQSGTSFAPQLWILFSAAGLVTWDAVTRRRRDYAWVLLLGAATWTAVELTLHLSAIRVMPVRTLLSASLPLWISIPLQGAAEGGAIAVIGLFFGDRLLDGRTRTKAVIGLIALTSLLVLFAPVQDDVARSITSRRNLFAVPSLLFCGSMAVIDFVFLFRSPPFRARAVAMFCVLLLLGSTWTVAVFVTGCRWIEVAGSLPGTYTRARPALQAFGLSYDVIVEIALAYIPFFAVPAMFGVIQTKRADVLS